MWTKAASERLDQIPGPVPVEPHKQLGQQIYTVWGRRYQKLPNCKVTVGFWSTSEPVSQVTGIQALLCSNTRCLADNHTSPALQQHPPLIQPCRGEQAAQLFQVSPANKKLYGNLRVSFTKRLLQQPLSRFSFWSFQVILYLDLHNILCCNSICTM